MKEIGRFIKWKKYLRNTWIPKRKHAWLLIVGAVYNSNGEMISYYDQDIFMDIDSDVIEIEFEDPKYKHKRLNLTLRIKDLVETNE